MKMLNKGLRNWNESAFSSAGFMNDFGLKIFKMQVGSGLHVRKKLLHIWTENVFCGIQMYAG